MKPASARALGGGHGGEELVPALRVAPRVWTATGLERQVFLDHTGRRRRMVATSGALAAALCAIWLGALITGALGFSNLPALRSAGDLAVKRSAHRLHVAARTPHRRAFRLAAPGHSGTVLAALVGGRDRE